MRRTLLPILLAVSAFALATPTTGQEAGGASPAPSRPAGPDTLGGALVRDQSHLEQCPNQGPVILDACPEGKVVVFWDQPVYDDEGLFVICLKRAPFCIDPGAEPAASVVPEPDGATMRRIIALLREYGDPPQAVLDLAAKGGGTGPLADATITCNDETEICTCISDTNDNSCTEKLEKLCTEASPFGSNAGVGTGC